MKRVSVIFLGCALVVMAISPGQSLAHHGRGESYVGDHTIQVHGTVNQVSWTNPHIRFLIDVTDENGEVTTWTIEHSNVSTLARLGYGRQTLKPGMEVTAEIYPGTQDRPIGLCSKVILADGTEIFLRGGNDSDRYNPLNDLD